jgi:hypothetical protein
MGLVIVPLSVPANSDFDEPLPVIPVLRRWVRLLLVLLALLLVAVFTVACCLNPYQNDGQPLREETHRQLGLPPCTFKYVTGKPCPSCGMTTSFALFMRGDLWSSLRANAAGTLLALICLAFIPWSLTCALLGRPLWIVSLEGALTRLVVLFLVTMLCRWGIVLLLDLTL